MNHIDYQKQAIRLAKEAVILDKQNQQDSALEKYFESLTYLSAALRYSKNSSSVLKLKQHFTSYIQRAEELKQILGHGPRNEFRLDFIPVSKSRQLSQSLSVSSSTLVEDREELKQYQPPKGNTLYHNVGPQQSVASFNFVDGSSANLSGARLQNNNSQSQEIDDYDDFNVVGTPELSPFENADLDPELEQALSNISKFFRKKIIQDDEYLYTDNNKPPTQQPQQPQKQRPATKTKARSPFYSEDPFQPSESPFGSTAFQVGIDNEVKQRDLQQQYSRQSMLSSQESSGYHELNPNASQSFNTSQQLPTSAYPSQQINSTQYPSQIRNGQIQQQQARDNISQQPYFDNNQNNQIGSFRPQVSKSQSISQHQLSNMTSQIPGSAQQRVQDSLQDQYKPTQARLGGASNIGERSNASFAPSNGVQTVHITIDPKDQGTYYIELVGDNKFKVSKAPDAKGKRGFRYQSNLNLKLKDNWMQLRRVFKGKQGGQKSKDGESRTSLQNNSTISSLGPKLQVEMADPKISQQRHSPYGQQKQPTLQELANSRTQNLDVYQSVAQDDDIANTDDFGSVYDNDIRSQVAQTPRPQEVYRQSSSTYYQDAGSQQNDHQSRLQNHSSTSDDGIVQEKSNSQHNYEIFLEIIQALKWRYGLNLQKLESFIQTSDLTFDMLNPNMDTLTQKPEMGRQSFKSNYPADPPNAQVEKYFKDGVENLQIRSDLKQAIPNFARTDLYQDKLQRIAQIVSQSIPQLKNAQLPISCERYLNIDNLNEVVLTLMSDLQTVKTQGQVIEYGYANQHDDNYIPYVNKKSMEGIEVNVTQRLMNQTLQTNSPLILMFGQDGSEKNIIGRALSQKMGGKYVFVDGGFLSELPADLVILIIKRAFDYIIDDTKSQQGRPVLVFNDFDNLCKQNLENTEQIARRDVQAQDTNSIKGEQLAITIITATQPHVFQHVLLNAFQVAIYLKLPDFFSRFFYLKAQMSPMSSDVTDEELKSIAQKMENYNFVDMDYILENLYNDQINSLFESTNLLQVKEGENKLWVVKDSDQDNIYQDRNQSPNSKQSFMDLVVAEQLKGYQLTFQPKQGYVFMDNQSTKDSRKFAVLPPVTYNQLLDKLKNRRPSGVQNLEFYQTFEKLMQSNVYDKWYQKLDKFSQFVAKQSNFQSS